MKEERFCVGGDGGPLALLQATAAAQWQGAADFENSRMNGGKIETDYDVLCAAEKGSVVRHYDRDMLALWDCEWGAVLIAPRLLSLPADTLVLTARYDADDAGFPYLLADIRESIQQGRPAHSLRFLVQDSLLRLQVGADSPEPSYLYPVLDIPITPGNKQCDFYLVGPEWPLDVVVITALKDEQV